MATYIVDIETDGLRSTKIHVMSYAYEHEHYGWQIMSTADYGEMRELMEDPDNTIVGHYFSMFDKPALEKVIGFKFKARVVDTLALAWYLMPERPKYGLESFGEEYGVPKPKIDDWENLSYEDYEHRCESDVQINLKLYEELLARLDDLYDGDEHRIDQVVKFLNFKMKCLAKQEEIRVKLDADAIIRNYNTLEPILEEKEAALIKAMPPGNIAKRKPATMYKKDGSLSVAGQRWLDYLEENGFPEDTEVVRDPANPGSTVQVKDWLFSLGWRPRIFKDGANGPVPQIRDDNRQLCPSVLALADKEPAIHELEGYTVIQHRMAILKSFLDEMSPDGYTVAGASGFTNTLRLKHSKPIVNLPGVTGRGDFRDGQIIRECIIAPKGEELCGSDISSLENQTKLHYMYDYDPDYVGEQLDPEFDPHLDLGESARIVQPDDVEFFREFKAGRVEKTPDTEARFKEIHQIRQTCKVVNYSATYKVGATKLGKSIGISTGNAKRLLDTFWARNWAIKKVANEANVKMSYGQTWVHNPVSNFWYSVRSEKDIFSTLNQGTGAFVFDLWIGYLVSKNPDLWPCIQYHDEVLISVQENQRKRVKRELEKAMEKVNEALQLNVEIRVEVKFGNNYAEVH